MDKGPLSFRGPFLRSVTPWRGKAILGSGLNFDVREIICFLRAFNSRRGRTTLSPVTFAPKLFSATDLVKFVGDSACGSSFRMSGQTEQQHLIARLLWQPGGNAAISASLRFRHRGAGDGFPEQRDAEFLAVDSLFLAGSIRPAVPLRRKEGDTSGFGSKTSVTGIFAGNVDAQILGPARGAMAVGLLCVVWSGANSSVCRTGCRFQAIAAFDVLGGICGPCHSRSFCTLRVVGRKQAKAFFSQFTIFVDGGPLVFSARLPGTGG